MTSINSKDRAAMQEAFSRLLAEQCTEADVRRGDSNFHRDHYVASLEQAA
jgi:hypothetical protein